jgi:N-acetylmuramoyl-L-alanine amidase
MRKYTRAVLIGFFTLLVAVVFGWVIFSKKKTVTVEIKNSVANIAEEENTEILKTEEQNDVTSAEPEDNSAPEKTEPIQKQLDVSNKSTDTKSNNENDSKSAGKIIDKFISWGFEKSSGRKIDTIIIHSSFDALGDDPYDIDGIIAEYKQYGVSAHYLIGRDGKIYHLVEDKNIAYHAGVSKVPDGRTGVNAFSIGIEMVNTESGKFTDVEYSAVNQLIVSLKKQYSIKYILGHDDIAPGRKSDPWNIDWTKVNK